MTPLELLAPARNADIGIAAIDCGADAVYMAGPDFGARKDAGNPVAEIERLCNYAHKFGARVFITFNIILRDDQLDEVHRQMLAAQAAGADAFIIRDPRICEWNDIRVPLHASTQCSIRDLERAKLFRQAGCSRVILERQLSLEQIRQICSGIAVASADGRFEVECFVHGALCVGYSGQCTLSEHITSTQGCTRSADRGECIQACRNLYDLVDEKGNVIVRNKALLSLRDFDLSGRLEDLAEAGVCSFKIEGRLKNISYVKNSVRYYDLALQRLIAAHPNKYCRASFGRVHQGFTPDPYKTFNRDYTSLYLDGQRDKWSSMDAPKSMGEKIGVVDSVRPIGGRHENVEVRIKAFGRESLDLRNGDGFAFVNKGEIIGFRADTCSGNAIICKAVSGLVAGVTLYRNISVAFEKSMDENPCKRFLDVRVDVNTSEDGLTLYAHAQSEDGRTAEASISGTELANNSERAQAMIVGQLSKHSSDYDFHASCTVVALPHLGAAQLNALRRELAEQLDAAACNQVALLNLRSSAESFSIDPRALQSERREGELLRSKYCIRAELGMCLKDRGSRKGDLFLLNNGRRFALLFDCKNCEMACYIPAPSANDGT